jgi:hypothetical protein
MLRLRSLAIPNFGLIGIMLLSMLSLSPALKVAPPQAPASILPQMASLGQKLPLQFIENQGQLDERVAYYLQGRDDTLYFTAEGLTLALSHPEAGPAKVVALPASVQRPLATRERWVVKVDFVTPNPQATLTAQDSTGTLVSYFTGQRETWHTGLKTYSRLVYHDVWPGIDLVYTGGQDRLKYEFVVSPGADPRQIRLALSGVTAAAVNAAGQLTFDTPAGSVTDEAPVAYQGAGEARHTVAAVYDMAPTQGGENYTYHFDLGAYDPAQVLVIDPTVVIYAGYLGGGDTDSVNAVAVDAAGDVYVTGQVGATATFPAKVGPDLTLNGTTDAFVAKIKADGSSVIYAGYIGGAGGEIGEGIAVDDSGNAYMSGFTDARDATFPVIAGPVYTGTSGIFVAKVVADGTALAYAGYLGFGTGCETSCGMAVDAAGAAYVTGFAVAAFAGTAGPDLSYNGGNADAFVAKVNPDGTALEYGGFIGGSGDDYGRAVAVDEAGNAYVTGYTTSSETTFPKLIGPDLVWNGSLDAFVVKVKADGTGLVYAGYIGGSLQDSGYGIAVDTVGNAYVAGETQSSETTFPEAVGPDLTFNGGSDAFVAKVLADGTGLVYAGYIGGATADGARGIALDADGNAYVTGRASSPEASFPVKDGPDLTHNGGMYDAYVAKVKADGSALDYAGYIGGSGDYDYGYGIGVDAQRNVYVVGQTNSTATTFPVKNWPYLNYFGGLGDGYVAKVGEAPSTVSGRITTSDLQPASGVTVWANGTLSATTNANGYYTLTQVFSGTYTLAPDPHAGIFQPAQRVVAVPPNQTGQDFTQTGLINVTISLYRTPSTSERVAYEAILGYFADAVYEMSNGLHRIHTVNIYQNGTHADSANIRWSPNEWPRAYPGGYGHLGFPVLFGDMFLNENFLDSAHWRGAGYALGHEWGHNYYGLYDEYRGQRPGDNFFNYMPHTDDVAVPNSVMNSQWNAIAGDYTWLNFSIATNTLNGQKKTAQDRVYAASGWETLARRLSADPRRPNDVVFPERIYYPELAAVAPADGQAPTIELATTPAATTRSALNIVWNSVAASSLAVTDQTGFPYQAVVESLRGNTLSYPQPVLLVASVAKVDPIAKASLAVSVTAPNGTLSVLPFADDGLAPDRLANDGFYSGIMPYAQNGTYTVTARFDNHTGLAEFTQASAAHSLGPNGEVYSPTVILVGAAFVQTATTTIQISNVQADDHGDTPQTSTVLPVDDVDVPGRIDRAGDVDVFQVTAGQTGLLVVRVTDLALDMHPHIRLLSSDGTTVLEEARPAWPLSQYFFAQIDANAGEAFYIEVSDQDLSAIGGLYTVSAGQPLARTLEIYSHAVYLPLARR